MSSYRDFINEITVQIENEIVKEKLTVDVLEFSKQPSFPIGISNNAHELAETRDSMEENELLQHSTLAVQKLRNSEIHFYRELNSYYAPIRAMVVFVKRVIRKLVRFIVEPIVEECNQNRIYTADAFDTIQAYLFDQEHLSSYGEIVEEELYNLQSKIVRLQQKVDTLEQLIQEKK